MQKTRCQLVFLQIERVVGIQYDVYWSILELAVLGENRMKKMVYTDRKYLIDINLA